MINVFRNKVNTPLVTLCAAFALLALVYASLTPPFEAPDEGSHFLYSHNLLREGALPILEDRDTVFASQSVQRHHPPLYYLIGAALISPTTRADLDAYLQRNPLASIGFVTGSNQNVYLHPVPPPSGDTALAVAILRLYSIAHGTGTIWLTYHIGRLAAQDRRVGLLAALTAACIPSFIHITASINNDNLVTFFFACGTALCLRIWTRAAISRWELLGLVVVCGGAALTKITGLALFGVVLGTLFIGLLRGKFALSRVLLAGGAVLAGGALIAGWWYLRNLQLYGDLLALQATLRIWARGGPPRLISLFELKGVSDSFWFVLGHLNIRGPAWLFDGYLPLVALIGVSGLSLTVIRRPLLRMPITFLCGLLLLVFAALLVSSSRINVSQGRILYPALPALCALLALSWRALFRRWAFIPALPLIALAVLAPFSLAEAFRPAQIVGALPADVRRIDAFSDGLELVAYTLETPHVQPRDTLRMTLYLRGAHPDNPLLFVKALHPLTGEVLGGVDVYPGMMPTHYMQPDALYAVPAAFRLDAAAPDASHAVLQLALGWRLPTVSDADDAPLVYLPVANAAGQRVEHLLIEGAVFTNPDLQPAPPQYASNVVFGGAVRLVGYDLSAARLRPDEPLTVTLHLASAAPAPEDWTITVGLLDANNRLIAQHDAPPAGYPTSAWLPAPTFTRAYTLTLPPDAPDGAYRLYIGVYRADLSRVLPVGDNVQGDVVLHPEALRVGR